MHPVPFAEAIPFYDNKAFRTFIKEVVGLNFSWVMGKERVVFSLPTQENEFTFAAPICFEDAFSSLCREFVLDGADFWLNLTNDSWSQMRSSEIQHFVAAKFRSIEHRRTLVRSTNAGVSGIVGAYGDTMATMPLFETGAIFVNVPVYKTDAPTMYTMFGDWFAIAMCAICGLLTIAIPFRAQSLNDLPTRPSARRKR
jgi:apolipoprotein N-acyltransferase